MRTPLEYGDNFPVPSGSWDPRVPWRFPQGEEAFPRPSWLTVLLPWVMLGLGMTLGVLWMSGNLWHPVSQTGSSGSQTLPAVSPRDSGELAPVPASEPVEVSPRDRATETRSGLV